MVLFTLYIVRTKEAFPPLTILFYFYFFLLNWLQSMISCSAPMRNLSMLTPMVSVFCLFFLLYHITAAFSTNPPYIAVDDIKLDCGSDGNSEGFDGWDWSGDINSKFFLPEEHNLKSKSSKPPKGGTDIKAPYTTARISYYQFTYVFPVTLGPKFVRLFFHPASYSRFERSTDFFTVKVGAFTLLRNFSASINLADSLHEHTPCKRVLHQRRRESKTEFNLHPVFNYF